MPDSSVDQTDRSGSEHYLEQMRRLAEVGASLCCYMPGAGNPEKWPESRCDCKYLAVVNFHPEAPPSALGEQTGCCEVRHAWRALAVLREREIKREAQP